jgi:hypothetical protein
MVHMRWLVVVSLVLVPSVASAHIALTFPAPRTTSQKLAVCGASGSVRGTNVTTFAPGSTITVTWKETVDHPGHYRIAFDDDGQDFPIPTTTTPGATTGMPTVLVDPIADVQGSVAGGRVYNQDITLPNIECTTCTLQLIQLMTDKPPYTIDAASNDIYYQCADITLSASAPDAGAQPMADSGTPPDNDAGAPNPGGGGSGGCSAGAGAGLLAALGALGLRRRRRR